MKAKLNPEGCKMCKGTGRVLILSHFVDCDDCAARRDRLQKQMDKMAEEIFESKINEKKK